VDDIYKVRILMGVLSGITGDTVPFKWEFNEQRAFEQIKAYTQSCADHCRVALKYGADALSVWFMTDACGNGVAAVVAQGVDWRTASVAAFFSAKLNPAQQNYPVHEQEMLAGVEGMLRYHDILQGAQFTWLTDHKGLIHLYGQKNLLGRQACWLEKIGEFDFEIRYVPVVENVLPDALSRMYLADALGTVRAPSEYVQHDNLDDMPDVSALISMPVLVGDEARAAVLMPRWSAHLVQAVTESVSVPLQLLQPTVVEHSPIRDPLVLTQPQGHGHGHGTGWGHGGQLVALAETGHPKTAAEFAM
jgi:hypothetical protein